ncbi:MAG: hypothetical protein AAGF97_17635, partial [Planctomycetota bacterium]
MNCHGSNWVDVANAANVGSARMSQDNELATATSLSWLATSHLMIVVMLLAFSAVRRDKDANCNARLPRFQCLRS